MCAPGTLPTAHRHRVRESRASRRPRVQFTSEESAVEPYSPSEKQPLCDACFDTKLVSGVNPLQLCDFSLESQALLSRGQLEPS